ncbi:unnamed protein product, partial [Callosobruchus maculatus]
TQKNLSFCQRLTLGFNRTLHSAFLKYSDVFIKKIKKLIMNYIVFSIQLQDVIGFQ